jgi:hypothetical protein
MRNKRLFLLGAVVGLLLLATSSDSYGQRRGGGARGGAAVGRGGAAAGGSRGGYVAGPYGGGAGYQRGGTVVGPAGGSVSRGAGGGSYTTQRGTTIDYGGAGRAVTGPGGATAGRGVGGVQVTTPGGREVTKVGTAGGVAGPGGRAVVGGSSVGVGTGPRGTAVTGSRGGAALGPGGVVAGGSRAGVAAGVGGVAAGGVRGGVAANPYGLSRYSSARGVVATGHHTTYVGRTALTTQGVYVRRGFVHYNCFTPAWYTGRVHVWRPVAWAAAAFWAGATWGTVSTYCSYPAEPVIYDYGSTVVYEDNRVYYDGEPVATAEEYATQATEIATVGAKAAVTEKEEWVSLGVFGMVQGDEKEANKIFQLAINKEGIIRGTYYDALSDTESAVSGSVDKRTQRAAWVVGDRKDTVYETGVGNLTEPETTMLVHFGKDHTQQWTLVRLEAPKDRK